MSGHESKQIATSPRSQQIAVASEVTSLNTLPPVNRWQVSGLSRLPPSKKGGGGEKQCGAGKGNKAGSTTGRSTVQEGVGRGESRGDEEHFGTMGGEYAQFYGSTCCERARNQVSKHAAVGAGAKGGGGAGVGVGGPGGAMGRALRRVDVGDRQVVMRALAGGEPFILTGLDVGPCVGRWSAQYLYAAARDKQLAAGVHVCPYARSLYLCTRSLLTLSIPQVCTYARMIGRWTWPGTGARGRARIFILSKCRLGNSSSAVRPWSWHTCLPSRRLWRRESACTCGRWPRAPRRHAFSKVPCVVTLHGKFSGTLTFEKVLLRHAHPLIYLALSPRSPLMWCAAVQRCLFLL